MRIAAIVLAAGRSKRFGPANKLLAIIQTDPLIVRVMKALSPCPLAETIVVTGRDHDAIAEAVAPFGSRLVNNPQYARGMGKSISVGINALGPDIDGALIVQADMPFVNPATISALVAKFDESGGQCLVVPEAKGSWGNPVLWPRDLFPELAKLDGAEGARALIFDHYDRFQSLGVEQEIEFIDIDSVETLQRVIELIDMEARRRR